LNCTFNYFNTLRSKRYFYVIALAGLWILFFIILENRYPYFFLQDDNRDLLLPNYVHAYRSLINGEFSMYNFHQFMGYPVMPTGLSGAQYPLTYVACFLSQLFFGHFFATVDLIMLIHVMIAGYGTYCLLRLLNLENTFAFFGALIFPLTSYMVYASNSWLVVVFAGAYLPWMFYFALKSYRKGSISSFIGGMIIRLLLVYTGYLQYFVCAALFEFIFISILIISDYIKNKDNKIVVQGLFLYCANYICVFFLSLPFLLPAWDHMQNSANRNAPLDFSLYSAMSYPGKDLLLSLFYPFTRPNMSIPTFAVRHMPYMSFLGYIPVLAIVIGIGITVYFIVNKHKNKPKVSKKTKSYHKTKGRPNIAIKEDPKWEGVIYLKAFWVMAIICLLWILKDSFLIRIIYEIPIINRFRWPMKMTIYFDFFLIIISSMMLYRPWGQLKNLKARMNKIVVFLALINFITLTVFYITSPHFTFAYQNDTVPFKNDPYINMLKDGRLINVGFTSWAQGTSPAFGHNYATLFDVQSIAGYDPIILKINANAAYGQNSESFFPAVANLPIESFRKDGIKWYIVGKEKEDWFADTFKGFNMVKKGSEKYRALFYDSGAYPMIYRSKDKSAENITFRETTNSIVANVTNKEDGAIVLNYIHNPYFTADLDGKPVNITTVENNKMSVMITKGSHVLKVTYRNPYFAMGLLISGGFLILLIIGIVLGRFLFKY